MALFSYQQKTQLLLNDPNQAKVNIFDLTSYINQARNQIAVENECVRIAATMATASTIQAYAFTSITVTGSSGVSSVLNIRMMSVNTASSKQLMEGRPWEWFNAYYLCIPTIANGQPAVWAQLGQGSLGSFYVYPIPSGTTYTLYADTVCLPINLALDSDAEAIPYPWTDAIPLYAAYLSYLNLQAPDQAGNMLQLYEIFVKRARSGSTPSVLPFNYQGGMGARNAAQLVPLTGDMAQIAGPRGRGGNAGAL